MVECEVDWVWEGEWKRLKGALVAGLGPWRVAVVVCPCCVKRSYLGSPTEKVVGIS